MHLWALRKTNISEACTLLSQEKFQVQRHQRCLSLSPPSFLFLHVMDLYPPSPSLNLYLHPSLCCFLVPFLPEVWKWCLLKINIPVLHLILSSRKPSTAMSDHLLFGEWEELMVCRERGSDEKTKGWNWLKEYESKREEGRHARETQSGLKQHLLHGENVPNILSLEERCISVCATSCVYVCVYVCSRDILCVTAWGPTSLFPADINWIFLLGLMQFNPAVILKVKTRCDVDVELTMLLWNSSWVVDLSRSQEHEVSVTLTFERGRLWLRGRAVVL